MRWAKSFILALLLAGAFMLGFWARGLLSIDNCLDNGGRWNYQNGNCEYFNSP